MSISFANTTVPSFTAPTAKTMELLLRIGGEARQGMTQQEASRQIYLIQGRSQTAVPSEAMRGKLLSVGNATSWIARDFPMANKREVMLQIELLLCLERFEAAVSQQATNAAAAEMLSIVKERLTKMRINAPTTEVISAVTETEVVSAVTDTFDSEAPF